MYKNNSYRLLLKAIPFPFYVWWNREMRSNYNDFNPLLLTSLTSAIIYIYCLCWSFIHQIRIVCVCKYTDVCKYKLGNRICPSLGLKIITEKWKLEITNAHFANSKCSLHNNDFFSILYVILWWMRDETNYNALIRYYFYHHQAVLGLASTKHHSCLVADLIHHSKKCDVHWYTE